MAVDLPPDLRARLQAAWEGRISGCQLGKPVELLSMTRGHEALTKVLREPEALPLRDYVPPDQDEKLELLTDLGYLLDTPPEAPEATSDEPFEAQIAALRELHLPQALSLPEEEVGPSCRAVFDAFDVDGTGLLDFVDQSVDRLVNRLTAGRADGSLVRISTPFVRGEELAARARLADFSRSLEPAIAEHWPVEMSSPPS